MNVLITSASRDVMLVREFQRALALEGGGSVFTSDLSPYAPTLYVADGGFLTPAGETGDYLDFLIDKCRQLQVRLLITARDEEVLFFAEHDDRFRAAGVTVMTSPAATVGLCLDKRRFIRFCRDQSVDIPRTYDRNELIHCEDVAFPLFAKPCYGKASKGTMKIESRADLTTALAVKDDMIIQEYVDAPEFTMDVFSDFDGVVLSVVPRERLRVFGGESFVGRTCKDPLLIEAGCRLATLLGLVGHTTLQCFKHAGRVKFTEVNPRFGGGAALGFAAGVSTPHMLVQLMRGKRLKPCLGEFRDGLVMLRYTQDVYLEDGQCHPHV